MTHFTISLKDLARSGEINDQKKTKLKRMNLEKRFQIEERLWSFLICCYIKSTVDPSHKIIDLD